MPIRKGNRPKADRSQAKQGQVYTKAYVGIQATLGLPSGLARTTVIYMEMQTKSPRVHEGLISALVSAVGYEVPTTKPVSQAVSIAFPAISEAYYCKPGVEPVPAYVNGSLSQGTADALFRRSCTASKDDDGVVDGPNVRTYFVDGLQASEESRESD